MSKTFPIVSITGPRQVGKTTLLMHVRKGAKYITFDREDVLIAAKDSPEYFLDSLNCPCIIDEVQYDPAIFRYLKLYVDSNKTPKGSIFLSGSQKFQMMKGLDESLAGRAGIVEMLGLSLREITKDQFCEPFVPTLNFFKCRKPKTSSADLWSLIFQGDLPEVVLDKSLDSTLYMSSYIDTYLRRDVRGLSNVGDLAKFNRFLQTLALLHGQILNKSSLAKDIDVSFATIDRWLSILEASNIVYLLKPFVASTRKRLIKSPKLYFLNSGIPAFLCGFNTSDELRDSDMAGSFFEGFVIAEILKSHLNHTGKIPDFYYFRDSNGAEIDLIIQHKNTLYPIEIKKAEIARASDTKNFKALDSFSGYSRGSGCVVCAKKINSSDNLIPLPIGNNSFSITASLI